MKVFEAIGPEGLGTYEVEWSELGPQFTATEARPEGILAPGFVDIHIHGAFGVDFMSASSEQMVEAFERLSREGYELLFPTSVTASPEDLGDFIQRVPHHAMVAGLHLEGPFISPVYPGAQPPLAISAVPNSADPIWAPLLSDERIKLMTLAPELDGAIELIRELSSRGVRVGMGHTNATYAEGLAGHLAGATHTTHTFNAMRPLHHREVGMVGLALLEDGLATELIYDRIHVSEEAAELLLRNKPPESLIAVSDGTMAAGLTPGTHLSMWGLEVVVGEGEVRLLDGTLAGSGITLLDAFRNLLADFGTEVAIRATSLSPRLLMGIESEPQSWIEFQMDGEIVGRRLAGDGFSLRL